MEGGARICHETHKSMCGRKLTYSQLQSNRQAQGSLEIYNYVYIIPFNSLILNVTLSGENSFKISYRIRETSMKSTQKSIYNHLNQTAPLFLVYKWNRTICVHIRKICLDVPH